jgi:plastocyanin
MSTQPVSRRVPRALIGVALLASLLAPQVLAAPAGQVQAEHSAAQAAKGKPTSGVAISGRPSHWQTQGPDAKRATCDTTTQLSLSVTFRGKTVWSRGTSLRFAPDKGVSVVTTSRKGKRVQTKRSSAALKVSLPRPTHGHSSANLKLAVTVRSVKGSAGKRLIARLGGLVQVLQGKKQLGRSTVRVTSRVACVTRAGSKAPAPIPVARVDIVHFAFSPMTVTVAAGTEIIWTNRDQAAHTVTASDGSWGSSTLARGVSFIRIFSTPGIYHYLCSVHPYMKGTVVVLSASPTPATSGGATVTPGSVATAPPTSTNPPLPSVTPTTAPAAPTSTPVPGAPTSTSAPGAQPTATPAPVSVSISNFAFSSGSLTIATGTTVKWTNQDSVAHTVTSDGNWDSGNLGQGATFTHQFMAPGTYNYYCKIHPFMTGVIIVTAPGSTPQPTNTPVPNTATPSTAPTQPPTSTSVPPTQPPTSTSTPAAPTDTPVPGTTVPATAAPSSTTAPSVTPSTVPTSVPTSMPTTPSLPPTPTVLPGDGQVAIQDFLFSPYTITIYAGQSITWMNNGQAPHTVTADDGSFDSGILLAGDSYSHTFALPGTYTYHCNVHPFMHGTVFVIAGPDSTPTATPTQVPNTPTDMPIPETATVPATDTPSATDAPTATVTPTSTPTQPTATDTPLPTATPTVTDTPVPPTVTATSVPATDTPSDTPVPSPTVVPSDTPTEATATETAIDTATAVPPTDTPPATDTATSSPTDTATTTAAPTDTATDTPGPATDTPTNTPSPTSTVSSSPVTVTISNFAFSPMTVTIQAGQSVEWANTDLASHTSTSDPSSTFAWNTGTINGTTGAPVDSAPVAFTTPGTYTYHCNFHPFMHGTVIVN